jgi:hypothetical protein
MLNKNNNKPKLKKEGGDAAGVGGTVGFLFMWSVH